MSSSRTRMAAVAGSLALSLSLVSAPVVMAQDDPADAIYGLMDAIEAKDFEALPTLFCADEAAQAAQFDLSALTEGMPPGMDVQSLLDAFIIDVTVDSVEVVSQTDTEAVAHVVGSMSMDINADALAPFIEAIVEMSGMEATPDTIEMFTGMMMSEFEAETTEIDDDITLVAGETVPWLICSELGVTDDITSDDGMSDDGMSDDTSDEATVAATDEASEDE